MSYNGIGLKTARGSGTNGYVQRNLGHLQFSRPSYEQQKSLQAPVDTQRPPNEEILEHDRKRAVEVKVAEWAEEQGLYDQKYASIDLVVFFFFVFRLFSCGLPRSHCRWFKTTKFSTRSLLIVFCVQRHIHCVCSLPSATIDALMAKQRAIYMAQSSLIDAKKAYVCCAQFRYACC